MISRSTGVSVRNSLLPASSALVPLVARDSTRLTWYTCGPTVYDVAHVGHARLFVSIDVLQRLLSDRFGVPLDAVMNVTDVDDKLLRRAAALGVDARALARDMEASFLTDMRSLGVRAPTRVSRVTDSMPEIVGLVERIVAAGFAYATPSGNVYFDVRARLRHSQHARLEPSRIARIVGDAAQPEHDADEPPASDKRFWADFALWKAAAAAPADLAWSSPFGRGRPGWHIECSAMCRAAFGEHLDVHAGGVDLRFPHHENEILQCEAVVHDGHQWPSYFLHVGHVHVAGQKMSKSLKNFVSVQECLAAHSAELFRWFCLMHRYDDAVEWGASAMQNALHQASRVREFCDLLRRQLARIDAAPPPPPWREHESALLTQVLAHRAAIDASLRANFDTATALHELNRLIKLVSTYVGLHADRVGAARGVLGDTLAFVTALLEHVGLAPQPLEAQSSSSRDAAVADAACAIRDRVRVLARQLEHKPSSALLWKLADEIRDDILPAAGVEVRDESPAQSHWRWRSTSSSKHHK